MRAHNGNRTWYKYDLAGRLTHNVAGHESKGGKPYAGRSDVDVDGRLKRHGERVKRILATFKVDGATLKEAEQWLIDMVKKAQEQDVRDSLGRGNSGNKLANRRNEIKTLIDKALPMCK